VNLNRIRDPNRTWRTKNGLYGWSARYADTGEHACVGKLYRTETEAREAAEGLLNAE